MIVFLNPKRIVQGSFNLFIVSMYNLIVHCKNDNWLFMVAYCHTQQYFSYIVAVIFIGGVNRSIQRKPSHRQTLSHGKMTNKIADTIIL